ncbi:MAG: hypothetical protein K0S54_2481 [Alphaproteobacteria bacterium]|nr:hypothetical protein [Alphaproteobacteria bacterium]
MKREATVKSVIKGRIERTLRKGIRFGRSIARGSIEVKAIRLGTQAVARGTGRVGITDDAGYAKFSIGDLTVGDTSLPLLQRLAQEWIATPERHPTGKRFPLNVMQPEDLFTYPEILDVALHDELLAAVCGYLGQAPRLFNIALWWTPPNETLKGSQLYHYDHRDTRQAKLFLNLNDVGPESGPLHFLPARMSDRVNANVGYSQDRYTDEEVFAAVQPGDVVRTMGPAGSAFLVDTARCLHFGSRGNKYDRLLLMVSFARANGVDGGPSCPVLDPVRERLASERYGMDELRRFILTVAK